MNFKEVIHNENALEQLITSSSSVYKKELYSVINSAKEVLFNYLHDESCSEFDEIIESTFEVVPLFDIDEVLVLLGNISKSFDYAMHKHKGFSFNQTPANILDESGLYPTQLCCCLIQWSCELLRSNSSSMEKFHRIQLIDCQLSWLSAVFQVLEYSEERFEQEDKNRTKSKPQYDFGTRIVNDLQSKGYQFEELKLVSEAIVVLLNDLQSRFEENKTILPSELMAFEQHKINKADINTFLTKSSVEAKYGEQWDLQYGKEKWRITKNDNDKWVLITAKFLKHFLTDNSPDKKMSSTLREKLSLNLKSGRRPASVVATTVKILCKELKLDYLETDKRFKKI